MHTSGRDCTTPVVVAFVNNFKDGYVQWSLPITFAVHLLPISKSTLGITVFESLHGYTKSHHRGKYQIYPRAMCLISCPLIFVRTNSRAFKHSFIVNSPIDKIWEFYTDVKHLEIVTPKEMRLKIINVTSEKLIQGSEIWLEAKLIIFKTRWHSLIRYQYLDEMVKGPFKRWTHLHIII
ncbi:MAG TPA: hypothetical protein VEL11_10440 [Candidatus Bathyarchaeia archaeon]|nr:hypothetical protein [Candidatus Bathyarchaeia archaeon]